MTPQHIAGEERTLLEMAARAAKPTHRHIKSGGLYTELAQGQLQTDEPISDMERIVAYRGEDGRVWFRPLSEFGDVTRFEPLTKLSRPSPEWYTKKIQETLNDDFTVGGGAPVTPMQHKKLAHCYFLVVPTGGGAAAFIPNPKADPHIEWSMRYGRDLNNPDCGRFSAAAILDTFDYLLSSNINMTEATRRLRILRRARAAASIGASMNKEQE